jgi:hypothetical protein
MSVIDKDRIQTALGVFLEERLPVVSVSGTNVHHPCQPKAHAITDQVEAGSRENFQQPDSIPAQKAGAKAHT